MISRRGALRLGAGVVGVAATGGALFAWRNSSGDDSESTDPDAPQSASTDDAHSSRVGNGIPAFRGNAARTGEMPGPVPGLDHPIVSRWTISPDGMGIGDPVVTNGMLFATGGGLSRLAAVDLFTARELWNADQYGEVFAPVLGDAAVFVCDGKSTLYAFEAATGRERWRTTAATNPSTGTAAVVEQTLFVAGSSGHLYAIDTATGNQRWSNDALVPHAPSTVLVVGSGMVFVSTESETIALDAASGSTRWASESLLHPRALRNDTLFAAGGDVDVSTLHALDASTSDERWQITLDQGLAELAVNDDSVFVCTSDYTGATPSGALIAFNAESGAESWRFEDAGPMSSPAIVDDLLIAFGGSGGFDVGELVALELGTGEERWRLPTPGRVHSPVFVEGLVILRGRYMTAYGNLILPSRLGQDTLLRGSPSASGIKRGPASAGDEIDHLGAREVTDDGVWVTVTIDGVTGWIPLDAIDPVTIPPEGEIYYMHNPA